MSLIISVRTNEGIVMASDSRMTLHAGATGQVHFSDTLYKTFCIDKRIGISTCGDSLVHGKFVASWMQTFEAEIYDKKWSVLATAQNVATFFAGLNPEESLIFHVGGYEQVVDTIKPVTYRVCVSCGRKIDISGRDEAPGARWDGMTETMSRLIKSVVLVGANDIIPFDSITQTIQNKDGTRSIIEHKNKIAIPANSSRFSEAPIGFEFFNLQDAIDFAKYAIQTTIDTIKFKSESLTVGGPIDILVIEPCGARWIAHKELHP